jgi:hypothetical protein
MLRASFMLAVIPVIVFAVAGTGKSKVPIAPITVATEGVRKIDMDTRTFNARWRPINDVPPATEVRYVREDVVSTVSGAVKSAPQPVPPSRHRLTMRTKPARLDVCQRHGMKRVNLKRPNGWPYWRCRR